MVASSEGSGTHYTGGRGGWAAGAFDIAGAYSEEDLIGGGKLKVANAGASYDFGFLKASGIYMETSLNGYHNKGYLVGLNVPIGAGEIHAAYTQRDGDTSDDTAKQFALGYVHNLSKRTALYATGSYIENGSLARHAVDGSTMVNFGGKSSGMEVGVRHAF